MKITKEILKERFKEFNSLYFDKKMPLPLFGTFIGEQSIGVCFYYPKEKKKRSRICLARNVNWTDYTLRQVLVHEMLHYYLGVFEDDSQHNHGKRFKEMMNMMNDKFSLGLQKTHPEIELTNKKQSNTLFNNAIRLLKYFFKR